MRRAPWRPGAVGLFAAEHFYRIDRGRSTSRNVAREERGENQYTRGTEKRRRIPRGHVEEHAPHHRGRDDGADQSEDGSETGQPRRLAQDEPIDHPTLRT